MPASRVLPLGLGSRIGQRSPHPIMYYSNNIVSAYGREARLWLESLWGVFRFPGARVATHFCGKSVPVPTKSRRVRSGVGPERREVGRGISPAFAQCARHVVVGSGIHPSPSRSELSACKVLGELWELPTIDRSTSAWLRGSSVRRRLSPINSPLTCIRPGRPRILSASEPPSGASASMMLHLVG